MLHTNYLVIAKNVKIGVYLLNKWISAFVWNPPGADLSIGVRCRYPYHISKVGAVHGCEKQCALDTGVRAHLNP